MDACASQLLSIRVLIRDGSYKYITVVQYFVKMNYRTWHVKSSLYLFQFSSEVKHEDTPFNDDDKAL